MHGATTTPSLRALLVTVVAFACLIVPSAAGAATDSTYATWTAGPPNDTSLGTPHKGYQTNTVKCAVCHATHKAALNGEILLRTTSADACVYCHVQTTIGGVVIYGGDTAVYTNDDVYGHQAQGSRSRCIDCHAVHGANTLGGLVTGRILRNLGYQSSLVTYLAGGNPAVLTDLGTTVTASGGWRNEASYPAVQLTAFCTGCHSYYAHDSSEAVTATNYRSDGSTFLTTSKMHPMKHPDGAWQAFTSVRPVNGIARWDTEGCISCHARQPSSGPGVYASNFPHRMPDNARFLYKYANSSMGSTNTNVADPTWDGVCNRCHSIWTNPMNSLFTPPDAGVGLEY